MSKPGSRIFYVIIFSQFCCTSLWFAMNAIMPQLQVLHGWSAEALGYTTSSIQLGFITGTLLFAIIGISDRHSPSKVYFYSSIFAALANILSLFSPSSLALALISRFITGFFLAGVYPVGMKIASDWQKEGLGHWLGALVGALVLGTSLPHALRLIPGIVDPIPVTLAVSSLSIVGGLGMYIFVKDGPFHKQSNLFSFSELFKAFSVEKFRGAALGYFGHMWELYAFWAFIPVVLFYYQSSTQSEFSIPLISFIAIASGFIGCIIGGKLSLRIGSKPVAALALGSSAICCLISPFGFLLPFEYYLIFIFFWGFMVVADSPQFSTLVALHAPPQVRGSAITITTCIGFAITIVSIQALNFLQNIISARYLLLILSPGPLLGLLWLYRPKLFTWKI